MTGVAPPPGLGPRHLAPNIFAVVMATGIVSIALHGGGYLSLAYVLFWMNVAAYAALGALLVVRVVRFHDELVADLRNHAKAPGFFTLAAGSCVLGNQCMLLYGAAGPALALGVVGVACWAALTYAMLPALMGAAAKPKFEEALSGTWLLAVVATQAVSVLASLLTPSLTPNAPEVPLFVALTFWLAGSMLYIWLISLIFFRILFLPLAPSSLTPPYWINMGAMAISTLAGARLVDQAGRTELLADLLPFLKGLTLLFWSTATWWLPALVALGVWRHVVRRAPLTYDHGYWAVVFPLGMYAACTQQVVRAVHLPFLLPLSAAFMWLGFAAWVVVLAGLVRHVVKSRAGEESQSHGTPRRTGGGL